MELKDVLGEIESDGANLVHERLLEWALTPPLWHAEAAGGRPHHQAASDHDSAPAAPSRTGSPAPHPPPGPEGGAGAASAPWERAGRSAPVRGLARTSRGCRPAASAERAAARWCGAARPRSPGRHWASS